MSASRFTSLSTQTGASKRCSKRRRTSKPFQPGMIGGATGDPVSKSTGPGTPTATAHTGRAGWDARSSSSIPRAVSIVSAGPRPMSHARCASAMTSPSRVARPTRMWRAPSAQTTIMAWSARKRSVRGARPPEEGPYSPSSRKPISIAASTRWATTPRPSPVSLPISGRVSASPVRTRLITRRRLMASSVCAPNLSAESLAMLDSDTTRGPNRQNGRLLASKLPNLVPLSDRRKNDADQGNQSH